MRFAGRVATAVLGAWLLAAPASVQAFPLLTTTRVLAPDRVKSVTVVAAGDIACDPATAGFNGGRGTGSVCRASAVDKVIQALDPDAVLALGDEQYDYGRLRAFRRSYDRTWGDERFRTFPVPGNHEYGLHGNAHGYFRYFGRRAGPNHRGWYSATLGTWRIVALNSNCYEVGCRGGSPQYSWLRHLLATRRSRCTLAFMHHPLVSSGPHGDDESGARPLWKLLYHYGVDVALVGHDHIYERFAPVNAFGIKNKAHGIREFVVGTGGAMHYWIDHVHRYSQARNTTTFGVLRLTLRAGAYEWRFEPAAGGSYADAGTDRCHGA
jgi:hypothetical protein